MHTGSNDLQMRPSSERVGGFGGEVRMTNLEKEIEAAGDLGTDRWNLMLAEIKKSPNPPKLIRLINEYCATVRNLSNLELVKGQAERVIHGDWG